MIFKLSYTFIYLIGFILFFPLGSNAQIQLKAINEGTKVPVAFATLELLPQKISVNTNENGLYNLAIKHLEQNDSIKISCVGYQSKIIRLSKSLNEQIIYLKNSTVILPEFIIIANKSPTIKTQKPKSQGLLGGIPNKQFMVGLTFDSVKYANKRIESVSIYISRGGNFKSPFRIRFFTLINGIPSTQEFYHENLVVQAVKIGWNTFKLPIDNLIIPSSGGFIAMEWLDFQTFDFDSKDYNLNRIHFEKYKGQYLGMGTFSTERTSIEGYYKTIETKEKWFSTNQLFNNFEHPLFKNQILKPLIALNLK